MSGKAMRLWIRFSGQQLTDLLATRLLAAHAGAPDPVPAGRGRIGAERRCSARHRPPCARTGDAECLACDTRRGGWIVAAFPLLPRLQGEHPGSSHRTPGCVSSALEQAMQMLRERRIAPVRERSLLRLATPRRPAFRRCVHSANLDRRDTPTTSWRRRAR